MKSLESPDTFLTLIGASTAVAASNETSFNPYQSPFNIVPAKEIVTESPSATSMLSAVTTLSHVFQSSIVTSAETVTSRVSFFTVIFKLLFAFEAAFPTAATFAV